MKSTVELFKAMVFATKMHDGQFRKKSGHPYIIHPLSVMELVTHFKGGSKNLIPLMIAAILHDTVEDTDATIKEIEEEFGSLVASMVQELTSDDNLIKAMGKNEYMKEKLVKLTSYSLTLKLLDRLNNISDHPTQKMITDTIELLDYIESKRKLSPTQKEIVAATRKILTPETNNGINTLVEKYV